MNKTRRKIAAALKAKIALKVLREQSTVADLSPAMSPGFHRGRFTPGKSSCRAGGPGL